jgi:membrane protease YdiL (CAAX protease family)
LVPGAILFSLANAALEDAAYRGVVLDALGPGIVAGVFQALSFAALHFQGGFPRGAIGVGLAFVYGLALGGLRRKAAGLLAPRGDACCHGHRELCIVLMLARR